MNRLIKQRDKLLLFNHKYWGKLKRKEWLVHGDRNSRYFHQRANIRRKKKLVFKLKNDCGVWIENQEDIADKFIADYSNRFKSNRNVRWNGSDLQLKRVITGTDNKALIRIPDNEEVK